MQTGYYATAWADIKNSPGWFGKLCLMALVTLIPIFGPIAVMGYLYGWARDISWNVHKPLPEHIFGNEDGKQYSRGFFAYVIAIVFTLIPMIIQWVYMGVTGASSAALYQYGSSNYAASQAAGLGAGYMVVMLICLVLDLAAWFFISVGTMRMSVYGRLSAGLQFGKIWAMAKHDSNGLWRIFGMAIVLGLIIGLIFTVIFSILVVFGVLAGASSLLPFFSTSGSSLHGLSSGTNSTAVVGALLPLIAVGGIVFLVIMYFAMVASMFVTTVIARALGYWTRQFDVPNWRGQDDPMPFELQQQAAGQYAQQAAQYGQPNAQYGQQTAPYGQQTAPYGQQTAPYGQQTAQQQYAQPGTVQPQQAASYYAPQPAQPMDQTAPAVQPTQSAAQPTQPMSQPAPTVQQTDQQAAQPAEQAVSPEQATQPVQSAPISVEQATQPVQSAPTSVEPTTQPAPTQPMQAPSVQPDTADAASTSGQESAPANEGDKGSGKDV